MDKSIQKGAYPNIDTFTVCTFEYMYLVRQIGIYATVHKNYNVIILGASVNE